MAKLSQEYDESILATDFAPDAKVSQQLRSTMGEKMEQIEQLDAEISHLVATIIEKRTQKAAIRTSCKVLAGMLAPVRQLPPETLGEIFLHCLTNSQKISLTQAPMLLMHVCRRWRRIVAGTPGMWTELDLGHDLELDPVRVIPMWLSSSGSLLLTVTLYPSTWPFRWHRHDSVRLVFQSFHRFRRFASELYTFVHEGLVLQEYPIRAPKLESFDLRFGYNYGDWTVAEYLNGCIDAPSLTAICLAQTSLAKLVSFQPLSLRRFIIECDDIRIPQSLEVLESCHNISFFKLQICHEIALLNGHLYHLPHLETLCIEIWPYEYLGTILEEIEVPTLQDLQIRLRFPSSPPAHFMSTVKRLLGPDPPLQRLSFENFFLDQPADFISLLEQLHNLRSLRFPNCNLDTATLAVLVPKSSTPPHTWPCPLLSSLGDVRCYKLEDLCVKLVRSRAPIADVEPRGAMYLRDVDLWLGRNKHNIPAFRDIVLQCDGRLKITVHSASKFEKTEVL